MLRRQRNGNRRTLKRSEGPAAQAQIASAAVHDDVVGQTFHAVYGEDPGQSVYVNVASPILKKVDNDLAGWAGDRREVPQEWLGQSAPLKGMPTEKVHGNVFKPLPGLCGICKGVPDHDF